MKTEEVKPTFYGSQAFTMLPLVGYTLISGTFSVRLHHYSIRGLFFTATISLFAGFFLYREKDRYWDSMVHGLAQYDNSRLVFILIVISIFSKLMNTGGVEDGFVWLSLKLGISRNGFVMSSFLVLTMISTGVGILVIAMFVVIPIFHPSRVLLGANPVMLARVLISGIPFGDAISPSSQVTNTMVMTRHDNVTGQPADPLKILRTRTPYILVAGEATMVIYLIFGGRGGAMGDISQIPAMSSPQGLQMLVPLAVLLLVCFRTENLSMGSSFAIVSGFAVGLLAGAFAPSDVVAIGYGILGLKGVIFEGINGMLNVVVSTIPPYGLITVAVDEGVMRRCCNWLLCRDIMGTTCGSETVLIAEVVITSILLAGCALSSTLVFGGMADRIGQESDISPEHRSVLLTANVTNFNTIIPIDSAFVMGSMTIINGMVQKHNYLPTISLLRIFSVTFYRLSLTGICVIWAVLGEGAGEGGR